MNISSVIDDISKLSVVVDTLTYAKKSFLELNGSKQVKNNVRTQTLDKCKLLVWDWSHAGWSDDDMYKLAYIFKIMRRGLSYIHNDKDLLYVHVVCGLPKFYDVGYKPAYEIPMGASDKISKRVYLEKANGECFHLSAFQYKGTRYWVFGSKNVHFVARVSNALEDISHMVDGRYQFAARSAKLFINMSPKYKIDEILDHLCKTGQTFVAESVYLDNQHLIKYQEEDIFFFAATSYQHLDHGYCTDPEEAIKLFKSWGLTTVECTVIDFTKSDALDSEKVLLEKIFQSDNSEGCCSYTVCDGKVIIINKHKSRTYVIRRMLREQMRKRATLNGVKTRFNKSHVAYSEEEYQQLLDFYAYCWETYDKDNFGGVFSAWCDVWERFSKCSTEDIKRYRSAFNKMDELRSNQIRLMAFGIPGCGKTSLLKSAISMFRGHYSDQDMIKVNNGKARIYHKQIKAMCNPLDPAFVGPILALGKSHHTQAVRDALMGVVPTDKNSVWIEFFHPEGLDKFFEVCYNRVLQRGLCHSTLKATDPKEVDSIMKNVFQKQYQPLTEEEKESCSLIRIDITKSKEEQLSYLVQELQKIGFKGELINLTLKEAIDKTYQEEILEGKPERYSIDIAKECSKAIVNHPTLVNLRKKLYMILSKKHHVTLWHKNNGLDDKDYAALKGKVVKIKVVRVSYDDKAAALEVELDVPCQNKYPHITIAWDKSVTPFYSNQMLEGDKTSVPLDLELKGTIMSHN